MKLELCEIRGVPTENFRVSSPLTSRRCRPLHTPRDVFVTGRSNVFPRLFSDAVVVIFTQNMWFLNMWFLNAQNAPNMPKSHLLGCGGLSKGLMRFVGGGHGLSKVVKGY